MPIPQPISLTLSLKRWKFALALPILDPSILPADEKTCRLCEKKYAPDFVVAGSISGHETATYLLCGCVLGFHCATEWLSPHERGKVNCPFCEQESVDMREDDGEELSVGDDFEMLGLKKNKDDDDETLNQSSDREVNDARGVEERRKQSCCNQ